MVAVCRSLVRVDLVRKFTHTYFVQNPRPLFQKTSCLFHCWNNTYFTVKDMKSVTKGKRPKTVWRPVCTQVKSPDECPKDVDVELEQQNNLNDGGSVEAGVVNELIGTGSSSSVLEENVGSYIIGGGAVRSEEKHTIKVEAAPSLIRFIKVKEGATQKTIEEETGVKIIFPSSKEEDYIIIEGISLESVTTASEKLQRLIKEAIKSPTLDYTHFVSLPLAIHPELVEKLVKFQNSVLGVDSVDDGSNEDTSDEEDRKTQLDEAQVIAVKLKAEEDNRNVKVDISNIPIVSYPPKASKSSNLDERIAALSELGIDKSIFIEPKTFHLTVLMLKLYNKDLVDTAAKVFQSLSPKVMDALDGQPVTIRLKGLECMRGSLAKARVLYAPVEVIGGQDRLLRACQVITDAFTEAGLVLEKDSQQKLKLHATLMNARHRKRKKRTKKFDSFDARDIFKQFGSEEWGEYHISEAHLSRRFVFDENGYYHCCACMRFPESCK